MAETKELIIAGETALKMAKRLKREHYFFGTKEWNCIEFGENAAKWKQNILFGKKKWNKTDKSFFLGETVMCKNAKRAKTILWEKNEQRIAGSPQFGLSDLSEVLTKKEGFCWSDVHNFCGGHR